MLTRVANQGLRVVRNPVLVLNKIEQLVTKLVWSSTYRYSALFCSPKEIWLVQEKIAYHYAQTVFWLFDEIYRRRFAQLTTCVPDRRQTQSPQSSDDTDTKRLCFLIGTLGPGGAERQLVRAAQYFHTQTDVKITVSCMRLNTAQERFHLAELESHNIAVYNVTDARGEFHSIKPGSTSQLPKRLQLLIENPLHWFLDLDLYLRHINELKPECLNVWLDETGVKAGVAGVLLGVPKIVISTRSVPPLHFRFHDPPMREAYRWLLTHPSVYLTNNSPQGALCYEEWLGLKKGSIFLQANALEIHISRPEPITEPLTIPLSNNTKEKQTSPIIGMVARFTEEKRHDYALDILKHLQQVLPCKLVFIGDGPLRKKIETHVVKKGLSDVCYFIGNRQDATELMHSLDLLLLTSRIEGLPNVLIEAQQRGVPVASSAMGGALHAFEDGETGISLPAQDAAVAAKLISEKLQDTTWMAQAAEKGPKFVSRAFDPDTNLKAFATFLIGKFD